VNRIINSHFLDEVSNIRLSAPSTKPF